MNKKGILLFLLILFTGKASNAQYNIVVQNGDASVYHTVNEAYEAAVDGDTIYLPGGSFNLPAIDKSLVWIGVGYHPDSCEATFYTRINSVASFNGEADNTVLEGIHFASNLSFGSYSSNTTDYTVRRCRIKGSITMKGNSDKGIVINAKFSECIMDGNVNANFGENVIIEKSVIRGVCSNFRNSLFSHDIFSFSSRNSGSGYSYEFMETQNCFVMNSIFNYYSYNNWKADCYNNLNNDFRNNIFAGNITFPDGTNTGTDNLTGVDLTGIFVFIDGSLPDYSYLHDFHLQDGCAAVGAGIAGTDIGIYGSENPFKAGGLPSAPHISNVNISTESENGLLRVEIEARAQDN